MFCWAWVIAGWCILLTSWPRSPPASWRAPGWRARWPACFGWRPGTRSTSCWGSLGPPTRWSRSGTNYCSQLWCGRLGLLWKWSIQIEDDDNQPAKQISKIRKSRLPKNFFCRAIKYLPLIWAFCMPLPDRIYNYKAWFLDLMDLQGVYRSDWFLNSACGSSSKTLALKTR